MRHAGTTVFWRCNQFKSTICSFWSSVTTSPSITCSNQTPAYLLIDKMYLTFFFLMRICLALEALFIHAAIFALNRQQSWAKREL